MSAKIPKEFSVERIGEIISPALSPELGHNINGPSLIKVPAFVEAKLGNYYLYLADHKGLEIKMAYADQLVGPWQVYSGGVLSLEDSTLLTEPPERPDDYKENKGIAAGYKPPKEYEQYIPTKEQTATIPHLASPEVIVDEQNETFTLYFHGLVGYASQMTKMAVSKDGAKLYCRQQDSRLSLLSCL